MKAAALKIALFPLLLACVLPPAACARPAQGGNRAERLFAATKPSVVQVRTLLKGSKSQNSMGSGFYVSADGLIVTNYHVVSSYALDPKDYEMVYTASDGAHGRLTLLAIDVRHDLALLQRKGGRLPFLRFEGSAPPRGEKLFSLGDPNDLGMSIVEGVNNGLEEHSFYDFMNFTGAINPGMSGGPVLDTAGRVVGINEATMGESRGFLVPARYAHALLAHWLSRPTPVKAFGPVITQQLLAHSAALVARLTRKPMPVQMDSGFAVPDAADPYIRCWADKSDDDQQFYSVRAYYCSGNSAVYVREDMITGKVSYEAKLFHNRKLDAFRFGRVLQAAYAASSVYRSDSKHFSDFACTDSSLSLNGMPVKAALCLRAYRDQPGLYDFRLRLVSLQSSKLAMVAKLKMSGLAFSDGMQMVRHFMEAVKWKG